MGYRCSDTMCDGDHVFSTQTCADSTRVCADCGRHEDEPFHPGDRDACPACDGPLIQPEPPC